MMTLIFYNNRNPSTSKTKMVCDFGQGFCRMEWMDMNSFEWMQSRHFSDKHQYSCSTKKKTPYRLHSFRQPCIAIVRHLKDKELCLPSYLPVLWTINNVCVPKQFCSDCRNNGAPLWPSLHLWIMQSELSSGLNAIIWKKKKKKVPSPDQWFCTGAARKCFIRRWQRCASLGAARPLYLTI